MNGHTRNQNMGGTPLESLEVFEDFESDFLILVLTSVARGSQKVCIFSTTKKFLN